MLDVAAPVLGGGWSKAADHVVSPVITDMTASRWPPSSCGWDEWYFFQPPAPDLQLRPFCNWQGVSLAEWKQLCFRGGFNLSEQLERARPEAGVGEGDKVFILARDAATVDAFTALAGGSKSR